MRELKTLRETRAAIKAAPAVLAQVRFGTSETWVRISKADALKLMHGMTGTPEHNEMNTGWFGTVDETGVWLG